MSETCRYLQCPRVRTSEPSAQGSRRRRLQAWEQWQRIPKTQPGKGPRDPSDTQGQGTAPCAAGRHGSHAREAQTPPSVTELTGLRLLWTCPMVAKWGRVNHLSSPEAWPGVSRPPKVCQPLPTTFWYHRTHDPTHHSPIVSTQKHILTHVCTDPNARPYPDCICNQTQSHTPHMKTDSHTQAVRRQSQDHAYMCILAQTPHTSTVA